MLRLRTLAVFLVFAIVGAARAQENATGDAATVYRIIASQKVSDRRVLFRSMSPEMKAALWRVHLQEFLAANTALSNEEQTVIRQFIPELTAVYFGPHTDDPAWEAGVAIARMQQSASAILPPAVYRAAFGVLGPAPQSPDEEVIEPLTTALRTRRIQNENCIGCSGAPDCECNLGQDLCIFGKCSLDNCKGESIGCGPWWNWPCNGMCH